MPARPASDRSCIMTDLHYADKDAAGTRHYRRVPAKLAEAAQQLGSFHHYIVLDACYRDDGQPYGRKNFDWTNSSIPTEELDRRNHHEPWQDDRLGHSLSHGSVHGSGTD